MKNLLRNALLCFTGFTVILLSMLEFNLRANSPKPSHKRALLVGISNYSRGRAKSEDWRDLQCKNDIVNIKRVLAEKFGFEEEDIHTLLDNEAKLDAIRSEFTHHLMDKASPGDIIVFHFSGHGQQIRDESGDEIDGRDECLVPFDYRTKGALDMKDNPRLIDDELGNLLSGLAEKMKGSDGKVKGDILVTIDSCHSGTGTRGIMTTRGRMWDEKLDGPEPKAKEASDKRRSGGFIDCDEISSGYVVFSACKQFQTAMEDESDKMGLFTKYLLIALDKSQPNSSYRDIYENLCALMARDSSIFNQYPQAEGELNKSLLDGQALPSSSWMVVKPLEEAGMIEIPAGELHGITKGSIFAIFKAGSDISEKKNNIAEAEVIDVDLASSRAKLTKKEHDVKNDSLMAAKAIEIAHNYGSCLKLFIEDNIPCAPTLKKAEVLNTKDARKDEYDIKIYHNREKSSFIIENRDGSQIEEIKESVEDPGQEIHKSLIGEWRRRFLRKINNKDLRVEIKLARVDVETAAHNPMEIRKERGTREVTRDEEGKTVLHEGEWLTFQVRNLSERSVFINILELDSGGAIVPVFPGTGPEALDIKDEELNCLPADGEWHRLPVGAGEEFQRKFVWLAGKPYGSELIKMIATKDPVDFGPLFDQEAAKNRGEGYLLGAIRGNLHPLALLLYDMNDGGVRGSRKAVSPGDWGTAELTFEVERRQQALL